MFWDKLKKRTNTFLEAHNLEYYECSFRLDTWDYEDRFIAYNVHPVDAFRVFIDEYDLYDTWEPVIFEVEEYIEKEEESSH